MRSGILKKIWLGISVLLIAYTLSGLFSYVSLRMVHDTLSQYSRDHKLVNEASQMLLENLIQQIRCFDHAVFNGDNSQMDNAHIRCLGVLKSIDIMQEAKLSRNTRTSLVALQKKVMIYEKDALALCEWLFAKGSNSGKDARIRELELRSRNLVDEARLLLADISSQHISAIDKLKLNISRRKRLEVTIMVLGLIISIVLMKIIIDRTIMKPLSGLMTCFAMGAGGNYDTRMREDSPGEIGLLSRYFNYFMDRIDKDKNRLQLEIAERKNAEKRKEELLEKLNRVEHVESIAVLAGGVAREIDSVLRPVIELSDMILKNLDGLSNGDAESIERLKKDVVAVGKIAEHASSTVEDLLSLGGLVEAVKYPEDINLLLEEFSVSDEFSELTGKYPEVSVLKDFTDDVAKVLVSPEHVIRILNHLCMNGLVAMSQDEGTLSIRTFPVSLKENFSGYEVIAAGRYTVVAVADTGKGIPAKNIGRIFDPFFSLHDKEDDSWPGMGLSVVRGIIKDHGGFVDLETEEGGGSTFFLYFPAITEDE